MTSSFIGNWLVSEYLYTPSGEFVGIIHQQRKLQPADDSIRVIQITEPVQLTDSVSSNGKETAALMDKRAGGSIFDLKLVGRSRQYLGPDVIGGGFSWQDGILTARGIWPNFGYNFTSFSMLLNPRRQVTGGKFYTANQEVATIVGLAVPEEEGYPEFVDGERSNNFRGERSAISPDGELVETKILESETLLPEIQKQTHVIQKQYGALREIEMGTAPGETISAIEVTDHASGIIAGIWKRFRDEKLKQVDVYLLRTD